MLRFEVTTDPAKIDFAAVYRFLDVQSNWAQGIPRDLFDRAMRNALCFAGFLEGEQIAFARVISDYATFANLVDVFTVPEFRGNGYATRLLTAVFAHPDLQGLRRFTLATRDKHPLYAKFGFHPPLFPETLMERYNPDIYKA
ncbi:GNAT family N-acetyltransferase [Asticcacaulis sp. 201]|uniref:GNAT family N-acetyltransferase n=1 Tax=Asticcacaulis sp. 201 TaxID=3028787 RepID=UPI0029169B9E|nr:GNAT family N-acetyltransferase [Asticcacaulis sp. 201]MDV6331992.1 GNAT family N-acetyltransferase [Asticcacaulis sp. 201]